VVPISAAREVFYLVSLPKYSETCLRAYPGVQHLPADAQSAMLSLVYNRGATKSGSSRREMKELEALVQDGDLEGMALQLEAMKRLWEGRGLDGLLLRRDKEAALVRSAKRVYLPGELVLV
jgi:GH24 family phage-related lysozyme (muramidase)